MFSDLEGHDKCIALNSLVSPTSVIFQYSIHVPLVALNTVYSDASCYASNSPETYKLHSGKPYLLTLCTHLPQHCPVQSG